VTTRVQASEAALLALLEVAGERGVAERYRQLAESGKLRGVFLRDRYHELERRIRPSRTRPCGNSGVPPEPCYLFSTDHYGAAFDSGAAAYEVVEMEDAWLIVSRDGSTGVYRPEGRFDHTMLVG